MRGVGENTTLMSASQPVVRTGFDSFHLHPDLARGVRAAGFAQPRPIQIETIPAALAGDDVLGLAQTGTGKTAAFALPLLQRLLAARRPGPRALVLAPTRELAVQIDAEIRLLARFTRLTTALVFGGVSPRSQVAALRRRPELVVACPGRLLDLLGQGALRLGDVEVLVLDEADHMFDMGFLPDIRRILRALPAERQNLLFSATMPREIRRLADDVLRHPHVVELSRTAPAETIEHALYPVPEARKRDLLSHLVGGDACTSAIVFTRTKHRARRLAQQLERAGHRAVALQGNMSQSQRDRAMRGFRSGRFAILVATDIAARGIDVSGVSHVINYDAPSTPEAYTHRIGRTGRAERRGEACTFVTPADRTWVRATERVIGEPIPRREVEGLTGAEDGPAAGGVETSRPRRRRRERARPAARRPLVRSGRAGRPSRAGGGPPLPRQGSR